MTSWTPGFTDKLNTIDWLPSSFHIRTSWGQAQFLQIFINFSPFYGLLTIWFSWRIVQQLDHFQDMIMVSHGIHIYYLLISVWLLSFGGVKIRYISLKLVSFTANSINIEKFMQILRTKLLFLRLLECPSVKRDNYLPQWWVELDDELSWLFTKIFRAFYLFCRK